jgi:hypothetical protein
MTQSSIYGLREAYIHRTMSANLGSCRFATRLFERSTPGARQATRSTSLLKTTLISIEHTQIPDWELLPGVHIWRPCAVQQLEQEDIGITLTWGTNPSRAD